MFHCYDITKIHIRGLELLIDYCKLFPSSPGSVVCTNGSPYPQCDSLSVRNLWLPLLWLCLSYLQAAAHPPLVLDHVPGLSFLSTQTVECGLSSHSPTDPKKNALLCSTAALPSSMHISNLCWGLLSIGIFFGWALAKKKLPWQQHCSPDFRFQVNLHGPGVKIAQPKFSHNVELVIN